MDKKLEATLIRRASGELRIDVKGMLRRSVSPLPSQSALQTQSKSGEFQINDRRESTVFVDPSDEELIATMMGWEEDDSSATGS